MMRCNGFCPNTIDNWLLGVSSRRVRFRENAAGPLGCSSDVFDMRRILILAQSLMRGRYLKWSFSVCMVTSPFVSELHVYVRPSESGRFLILLVG
jgi:hypothetical protein